MGQTARGQHTHSGGCPSGCETRGKGPLHSTLIPRHLDPTLSLNLGLAKPHMPTEPQSQMKADSIWGPSQSGLSPASPTVAHLPQTGPHLSGLLSAGRPEEVKEEKRRPRESVPCCDYNGLATLLTLSLRQMRACHSCLDPTPRLTTALWGRCGGPSPVGCVVVLPLTLPARPSPPPASCQPQGSLLVQQDGDHDANDEDHGQHGPDHPDETFLTVHDGLGVGVVQLERV